ncbi:3-methyl-2-oxobutanoate hydroxymethyltransferase [Actinoplanes sp. SE50]|uniref:isocitrate lyase/PEP mutase family protein n=1 Tax=unclassified Actinoplanes TaxID=2626549 RepID=UPI00023EE019|nr:MULTISPECIES: isocitrate lyase/phosphoenolpyruvate mutase family protein [unclassified Actinoplanes]AEV88379.1 3-methyl-2-oxobutanoate hydroxymethyltransferase [Actinoplanes sp. SE50/110]ATO86784.1 3-methyl-2-oxobutanoate hydroxymethyltransferase [Actinoplanes sp. SE50]SLM04202.1 3-methyl-2-oxobutanoate hydroxymethyltransferase [Actinoplanes sp. SE50/110]
MTDFTALHQPGSPLVLVNVWDVASARIVAAAGAAAVATTSAGVAWSLGVPDGDALGREAAVAAARRIVAAVSVPVSVDVEAGYGDPARTLREMAAAGVAGVNLEDGRRSIAEQTERLAAARAAAPAVFLNARIDTLLFGLGDVTEAIERGRAYRDAGADGIFVPGATDPAVVGALVAGIPGPVNVMAGPGAPSIGELAKLGVARISLGSAVAQAAYGLVDRAAREAFTGGGYAELAGAADYGRLNELSR